jgi:hypothetical protein
VNDRTSNPQCNCECATSEFSDHRRACPVYQDGRKLRHGMNCAVQQDPENAICSCSNRHKALRGEIVNVTKSRLLEMQKQAVDGEGIYGFHWHWAAALNELIARRAQDGNSPDETSKGSAK